MVLVTLLYLDPVVVLAKCSRSVRCMRYSLTLLTSLLCHELGAGQILRLYSPQRKVISRLSEVLGPQAGLALRPSGIYVICFDSLNVSWQLFGLSGI